MTKAEEFLWSKLRRSQLAGYKFRRQHRVGRFVVDFYCSLPRLAIELDGGYHDTERQQHIDHEKSALIQAKQITLSRFTNEQVLTEAENVLQATLQNLNQLHQQ